MRRWLAILAVAVLAVNPAAVAACTASWNALAPSSVAGGCASTCCVVACCCEVETPASETPVLPDAPAPAPRDGTQVNVLPLTPLPVSAFVDAGGRSVDLLGLAPHGGADGPRHLARLCRWLT